MGLAFCTCDVVGAVIGKTNNEEITVTHHKIPGNAGIVGEDLTNKPGDVISKMTEKCCTVRMKDILSRFGAPNVIDYFSLDVEGAEELVLDAFPLRKYKVLTLSTEEPSDRVKSQLKIDQRWIEISLKSSCR